jgi:tRNA(fMet)-specific endonuclease VapC
MEPALLDTDIVSEIWRGKNSIVNHNARIYRREFGRYTTSAITVVELIKGFAQAGRDDRIQEMVRLLAPEEVIPLESAAATLAGRIYGELEQSGQSIGRFDPLIAGIALRHGLTLISGNTKHYQRIVDLGFPLKLGNWRLERD